MLQHCRPPPPSACQCTLRCCGGRPEGGDALQGGHALGDRAQLVLLPAPASDGLTLSLAFPPHAKGTSVEALELHTSARTVEAVLMAAAQAGLLLRPPRQLLAACAPLIPAVCRAWSASGRPQLPMPASRCTAPCCQTACRAQPCLPLRCLSSPGRACRTFCPGCRTPGKVRPACFSSSSLAGQTCTPATHRLAANASASWLSVDRAMWLQARCSWARPTGSSLARAQTRMLRLWWPGKASEMPPPSSALCHRRPWPTPSRPAAWACRCQPLPPALTERYASALGRMLPCWLAGPWARAQGPSVPVGCLQDRLQALCGLSAQSVALASGFLYSDGSQVDAGFGRGYSICVPEVCCAVLGQSKQCSAPGRPLAAFLPSRSCASWATASAPSGSLLQDCDPCEKTRMEAARLSWPSYEVRLPAAA